MADTRQFANMGDLVVEKTRLDTLRHYHGERLERHWAALRTPEVRTRLVRHALIDLVLSWRPANALAGMIGGGHFSSALTSAVFRRGSLSKRLLIFLARSMGPYFLKQVGPLSLGTVLREFGRSFDRVRQYWEK